MYFLFNCFSSIRTLSYIHRTQCKRVLELAYYSRDLLSLDVKKSWSILLGFHVVEAWISSLCTVTGRNYGSCSNTHTDIPSLPGDNVIKAGSEPLRLVPLYLSMLNCSILQLHADQPNITQTTSYCVVIRVPTVDIQSGPAPPSYKLLYRIRPG